MSVSAEFSEPGERHGGRTYRLGTRRLGFGLLREVIRARQDHLAFLDDCARVDADIVQTTILTHRLFVILEPDAVREVMVADNDKFVRRGNLETAAISAYLGRGMLTTDGEAWLRWKRMNAPAFTRAAVERAQRIVEDSVERSLAAWPRERALRPLFDDFLRLAVTATTAAFLSSRPDEAEQELLTFTMIGGPEMIFAMACARTTLLARLPFAFPGRVRAATGAIDRLLRRSVERREAEGPGADADLLDVLLQHRRPDTGAFLSDAELRDQLVTAVIAAPENIATTLSWACYALARNPPALARLRDSLARGEGAYLEAVVEETLRRYAATPMVDRVAAEDVTIGGVRIAKGSLVVIPIATLHNHPRFWTDPRAFRPERFLDGPRPDAYFPFGYGPRRCIGERLARLVIDAALRRFVLAFEPTRPSDVEPGFAPLINLRPADRMKMWIERRG